MVVSLVISNYFITLFSLIGFATLIICGWFAATRGWEVALPNGKLEKKGKIFKAWYFFWFQEKGKRKVYYEGAALGEMRDRIAALTKKDVALYGSARLIIVAAKDPFIFPKISSHFKVGVELPNGMTEADVLNGSDVMITVYQEYSDYIYPEWLRDMMAGCITCHPTVYGNIIFWVFALCAKYTKLGEDVYLFLDMNMWAILFTWIGYWLALAYTCTVAWQKMPD